MENKGHQRPFICCPPLWVDVVNTPYAQKHTVKGLTGLGKEYHHQYIEAIFKNINVDKMSGWLACKTKQGIERNTPYALNCVCHPQFSRSQS
jgi:hypothetical protein